MSWRKVCAISKASSAASFVLTVAALPCFAAETKTPGASADAIFDDWLRQDAGKDAPKCFTAKTGAVLETKALQKVLARDPLGRAQPNAAITRNKSKHKERTA